MLSFKDISQWKQPAVIAHRGASAYYHENTIRAFEKAIELNADAVELDVRRTKDNQLVVHHDAYINTIGKSASGAQTNYISEMTLDDIKQFNESALYQIPTLAEVCSFCSDKIALNIELKESRYEKEVVELALQYFKPENILFSSFQRDSINTIKQIDNKYITGFLLGGRYTFQFIKDYNSVFDITSNFDIILPHYSLCMFGFLRRIEFIHKPAIVWTVDRLKSAQRLIAKGAKGIISNDPAAIRPL